MIIKTRNIKWIIFLFIGLIPQLVLSASVTPKNALDKLIGKNDAVIIVNETGKTIYSKNPEKKLVPASTLKLLTSLAAFHFLGTDFRFKTEFYLDPDQNLMIKGFGDPLIISEVIAEISAILSKRIQGINDIILDDSFFVRPLIPPGVSSSYQPYDATNGALCVNFNTVSFKRKKNGKYISAEPQTPLLPFVLKRINESKLSKGRIVLPQKQNENTLYAGHLFRYFFEKEGIKISGGVRLGIVALDNDALIHRYYSKFSIDETVSKILNFSNNFMTNQVLVVMGAEVFGSPGTLEKGVAALIEYGENILGLKDIQLVEGSGISRKNRISAKSMLLVLDEFVLKRRLMRQDRNEYYKTGTLRGIQTRAGYIDDRKGGLYKFVVFVNTSGKTTMPIMKAIHRMIEK